MPQNLAADEHPLEHPSTSRRSLVSWWPAVTGFAVAAVSIVTDDPDSIDGIFLTLLIPVCAYAVIACTGRRSWSCPLTGLVVVIYLTGEALSVAGSITLSIITVGAVGLGAVLGRWRPPPAEMGWQPWGAMAFLAGVLTALWLDVTAAKVVVAVGLLLHGAWDIVHWRRRAVVSRTLAEWCAALDLTLGVGVLVLVLFG